jgi:glycosyltransferase involved in cell wall biosynthesis
MRVGLVIYGDLETVSGGYLYDRQLVEHLRRQGDHVHVFSQEQRGYAGNLIDGFNSDLVDSIHDANLDVLLQDELNHGSLIMTNRRLRTSLEAPIISIVHHLRCSEAHPRWQNAVIRMVERRYLRSVDGFIFNGQTTKSVVHSVAGVSEPSIVAEPAGDRFTSDITNEEIRERSSSEETIRIVFLGNVIHRKGLHTLLTALATIPGTDWELSVVGRLDVDEDYVQSVRHQIQRSGLFENVTLYGPLPDREIARLLRRGHILAVPSSYEGYGIAYLEGMAFGLPAIATTSGAAREIITHGENGWLIEPDDAGALRQIITGIRDDRSALIRVSLGARERFLAQPGWEASMSRIRSFLQEMTGVT